MGPPETGEGTESSPSRGYGKPASATLVLRSHGRPDSRRRLISLSCYRATRLQAVDECHCQSPQREPCSMKALVKEKPEPGLWLEEQPMPEIGPDDVLVKVHKTGICGTDIHIFNWDEWAQKTIPT